MWPSLLAFEIDVQHDEVITGNLRRLFHIDRVPSDTAMREIIDEIPPEALHEAFTRVFVALQRSKDLEPYVFMDGYYLVALDGTGVFSSQAPKPWPFLSLAIKTPVTAGFRVSGSNSSI